MWIEERERTEKGKATSVSRHEAFLKNRRTECEARNKPGWSLPPSNVTQAAVHKERCREQITQKKKTYKLF